MSLKRILALTGAGLLVIMYLLTLFFALSGSENYHGMLMGSIAATIIVPVVIYGYILVYRLLKSMVGDPVKREIEIKLQGTEGQAGVPYGEAYKAEEEKR